MRHDPASTLSHRGKVNSDLIWPRIRDGVKERERQGPHGDEGDFIDLTTAENWLMRPELIELMRDGVANNFEPYHMSYETGFQGDMDLVDALAGFFTASPAFAPLQPVESKHVAVAPGAASCLQALLYNICDPGDGVLVPAPYWGAFRILFRTYPDINFMPVQVERLEDCFTDKLISSLDAAIDQSWWPVKALLLTNPQNPLAQCYPQSLLEKCIAFCGRRAIHCISDEVYALSVFDAGEVLHPTPFKSILSFNPAALGCDPARVHMVWSFSKDFGASGIRLGCSISQNNQPLLRAHALTSFTQTSSLAAVAALALLKSPHLDNLLQMNSERLSRAYGLLTSALKKINISYLPATAGPFVFVRLAPHAKSWQDEADVLAKLRRNGVAVASGRGFGNVEAEKGWARITFAVDEVQLKRAISLILETFADRVDVTQ